MDFRLTDVFYVSIITLLILALAGVWTGNIIIGVALFLNIFITIFLAIGEGYSRGYNDSQSEGIMKDFIEEKKSQPELSVQEREAFKKGADFEDYVLSLFPETYFSIVHRTPTREQLNGRYAEVCINPDLKMRDRKTDKVFWIECKYRSHVNPDYSLTWCTEEQLDRYVKNRYETNTKTYVIIGLGGKPSRPERLFCLDLDRMKFNTLFRKTYESIEIPRKPFESYNELKQNIG